MRLASTRLNLSSHYECHITREGTWWSRRADHERLWVYPPRWTAQLSATTTSLSHLNPQGLLSSETSVPSRNHLPALITSRLQSNIAGLNTGWNRRRRSSFGDEDLPRRSQESDRPRDLELGRRTTITEFNDNWMHDRRMTLGAEVVFFYGWHTQSKNFTDRLRTLAKKYIWTEATKRINLAISESCRTGGSQRDLTAQHLRVVDPDLRKVLILDTLLPTGLAQYDVDQYGILCKWHSWRATDGQSSQYGSAVDEARAKAAAEAAPEMAVEEAGETRQRGVEEPTTRSSKDRRANSRGEEPKGDTEAGASVGVEGAVIQERAEAVCVKPGEKQREIQHMTKAAQYAKDKEKEDETSPTDSPDEEEVRSDAEAQWDEGEAGAEEEEVDEETAQSGGADGEEEGLEAESQVDEEEKCY
ncbi:hypothetical protein LTR81_025362 [Elasticomyces elasticus]